MDTDYDKINVSTKLPFKNCDKMYYEREGEKIFFFFNKTRKDMLREND